MEVEMTDVTGGPMEAEGFSLGRVWENASGSNALRRRDSDRKIGWGEDRDGRRADPFYPGAARQALTQP
jgi:hypothetical protein